jgi:hypothetical protein
MAIPGLYRAIEKEHLGEFCLPACSDYYSLENSVARLRFPAVLRTKLLLGPTRDVRVLGSAVPSEQFLADHASELALLNSEYFPALVSGSYPGADPGSHHSLSSSLYAVGRTSWGTL